LKGQFVPQGPMDKNVAVLAERTLANRQ